MPKVKMKYLGVICPMVAKSEEDIEVEEGASLGDVIQALGLRYGERFRYSLQNVDGTLIWDDVAIVVDGLPVHDLNFLLKGGQKIEIALLPMMVGG